MVQGYRCFASKSDLSSLHVRQVSFELAVCPVGLVWALSVPCAKF